MRKYVDHIITLAKRGDDHARQQAKNYIYDHELVDSVFEEVGNRYEEQYFSEAFLRDRLVNKISVLIKEFPLRV